MFGNVNTISIPIDAILIVSLLIVFVLLVYSFNNILNNDTNKVAQKIDLDSSLELVKNKFEDQFTLEAKKIDQKNVANTSTKKLDFLTPSKLFGMSGIAIAAIGGASLLGWQNMTKTYEGLTTSSANIKLVNKSGKSQLSIFNLKPFNKPQTNIKKISYITPFLSNINSSKDNYYYQVKEWKIESNFSF